MSAVAARLRRSAIPYLLSLPAGAWLLIFFLIPLRSWRFR